MEPNIFSVIPTVLLLLLSAFFSASETALFSIQREKVNSFKESRKKRYRYIYILLNNGQQTLMLILLGNLITNIAIVGHVTALVENFIGNDSVLLILLITTTLILVFGEILPKSIALRYNESIAMAMAPILLGLQQFVKPILLFFQFINISLLSLFSRHLRKPSPFITTKEYLCGLRNSLEKGNLSQNEFYLISNMMSLSNTSIEKIMTHRSNIDIVDINTTISMAKALMLASQQHYICIHSANDAEEIDGVVYLTSIFSASNNRTIKFALQAIQMIPASLDCVSVLSMMVNEQIDQVFVHDEFGVFAGVFDRNDGFAKLFDLQDKTEKGNTSANTKFKIVDCTISLDEMAGWIPPSLELIKNNYRTVNGLITGYLGRIPLRGELFAIDGWRFYIISSQGNRINMLKIEKRSNLI